MRGVDKVSLKEDLKSLIAKEGLTISEVLKRVNEKYGRNETLANFSSKLKRETLKYKEIIEILDVIGYKNEWIKK